MNDEPAGPMGDAVRALPMFPLGSVTLPGAAVPLHVFEPRYRALVQRCLSTDRRFGSVLIERGSEVGGGDVRCSIGAALTIVRAEPAPDGRWSVLAVATERVRVVEWLPDAPHPQAIVETQPDAPADDRTNAALDAAQRAITDWLDAATSLGLSVPSPVLPPLDDPVLASFRLVALSPLGPLDRQHLLEADGPTARCTGLVEAMDGQVELLRARFGDGDD